MKRGLALLLLVLHLTGCHTWRPVTVSPRQLIEEEQPERLRIRQADGKQLDIRDPRVERDSLTAMVRGRRGVPRPAGNGTRSVRYENVVRIALTDVTAVEARHLSVFRTVAVTVLGLVVSTALALVICESQSQYGCFY